MAAQRALYYFRVARKMAMRFKLGTLIRSESHCLSAFEIAMQGDWFLDSHFRLEMAERSKVK